MAKKHIIELLIETNKKISGLIDKMQTDDLDNKIVIDHINDSIRELDSIVEHIGDHG